jgi:arylsulfatase A-like enzyme
VYGAMIVSLDRAVGTVLASLRETRQEENTIVAFVSDNGGTAGVRLPDINAPYRGWKATFFGGGIRSPLLLQWPARIPRGTVVKDALVSHIDLFPTILRAAATADVAAGAGADPSAAVASVLPAGVQGQDLMALVEDAAAADRQQRHLFFRSSHYKAIIQRNSSGSSGSSAAVSEWKYSEAGRPERRWLFDLRSDPEERTNLADRPAQAALQRAMQALLAEEDARQAAPLWPSRSETPLAIDKQVPSQLEDEYVYWPN